MKLVYKFLIPIIALFAAGFYAATSNLIASEKDIVSQLIGRTKEVLTETLEERRTAQSSTQKEYIAFVATTAANVLSDYTYNFNLEGLETSIRYFLSVDAIKAISVFDDTTGQYLIVARKQDDGIEMLREQKALPAALTGYDTLARELKYKDESFGTTTIYYDTTAIEAAIRETERKNLGEIAALATAAAQDIRAAIGDQVYLIIALALVLMGFVLLQSYQFVLKPLGALQRGLDGFFLFLQNKTGQAPEITIRSRDEFGQMARSLNENIAVSAQLHAEIHELNTNLEHLVDERTKRLNERSEKVEALLDNADQGFLSFGGDFLIDDEYSAECEEIFRGSIAGRDIAELLYPKDADKRAFFRQTLGALVDERDPVRVDMILSLLKSDFLINKKAIHIKHKRLDSGKFMLILTDVTAEKLLKKKFDKERQTLKMIVSAVSDSAEFFEIVDDFRDFIANIETIIETNRTPLYNLTAVYRVIHTFKGLFAQKEMVGIPGELHKLESTLSELMADKSISNEELRDVLAEQEFAAWLQRDLNIIKDTLGPEFFEAKGKISVHESTLEEIEGKLAALVAEKHGPAEVKTILEDIKRIKTRPLHLQFNSFPKLVSQISERLGKSVYPLEVLIDRELVVQRDVRPFLKSLIHVFRNSVDHGIESMEARAELSKDEIGTVTCTVDVADERLCIRISDDGQGIDPEKIAARARDRGIDVAGRGKRELLALIFDDAFSTAEEVSEISGRGVGLAAVKDEIDKLGGEIEIQTQKGVGTTFIFTIPV